MYKTSNISQGNESGYCSIGVVDELIRRRSYGGSKGLLFLSLLSISHVACLTCMCAHLLPTLLVHFIFDFSRTFA